MKRLYLLLILLVPKAVTAQEFAVTTIQELPQDSTAITSPRYDFNDALCAALIVEIKTVNNISFSGNIIGDICQHGDIYTLYLTTGTKRIKLMHEDYLPFTIDFSQFGVSIKGGNTYKVNMSASSPDAQSLTYGSGAQYLVIKSASPLTKVEVNEMDWPIKDGKAKKMVPLGRYEYAAYSGNVVIRGVTEVTSTTSSKVVNVKFE